MLFNVYLFLSFTEVVNFKPLRMQITLQDKVRLNIKYTKSVLLRTGCWGFFLSFVSFFFPCVTCHDTSFLCECNGPERILAQEVLAWVRNLTNSSLVTCLFWANGKSVVSLGFGDCYQLRGRSLCRAGKLLVLLDKYRADSKLKRQF